MDIVRNAGATNIGIVLEAVPVRDPVDAESDPAHHWASSTRSSGPF